MEKKNWNEASIEEIARYCIENEKKLVIEDGKVTKEVSEKQEELLWKIQTIFHNNYITTEDLLWIIGTETAVEIAQEIRDKEEKSRAERERREMEKGKVSYD